MRRSTLVSRWQGHAGPEGTRTAKRGQEETLTLTKALRSLWASGLRTPCSDSEVSHWWLSEEPRERRKAVRLCRDCPVVGECGAAARARGEMFGVWGGIDHTRNPKARMGGDDSDWPSENVTNNGT